MLNRKIVYLLLLIQMFTACSYLEAREISFLRPPQYSSYFDDIPPYSELETIDLSGEWRYLNYKSNNWKTVLLPASWEDFSGRVRFRKNFTYVPPDSNRQVYLVSLGISGKCRIFFNDEFIIEQDGPYLDVLLPNRLFRKNSTNTLEIEINNKLSPSKSIPLLSGAIIPENYGGITGDIFLVVEDLPNVVIQKTEINYDNELKLGEINLKTAIIRSPLQKSDFKLSVKLLAEDKSIVSADSFDINRDNIVEGQLTVKNPLPWSPENPQLYNLEISVVDGQQTFSKKVLRIGFKQFDTSGDILLNGEKIQLRGIKYRPVHPDGFTFNQEDYERDIELILAAGANSLLINDPPHPYLLKLCDDTGIMVFQSNSVQALPNAILEQPKFQSLLEDRLNRIYGSLHHHVSVCGWLMGLDMQPDFVNYINLENLVSMDRGKIYAGILGDEKRIVGISSEKTADICYDVGPVMFSDDDKQQMRQADILFEELDSLKTMDGIFIREFADFKSGRYIMFQSTQFPRDKTYYCGLVKRDRSERVALRELRGGWFGREPVESIDGESREALIYTLMGFGLLLVVIIYTRSNHVFRVQLTRVFNHPYGFYLDVKNKRFIQKMQTFILGFCAILVMALISSSLIHSQRYSIKFDFISALLLQNSPGHLIFKSIVNNTWISILYMAIFFLFTLFLVTVIFKLTTILYGQKITFRQSVIYTCWAGADFLLLTPLTIIFYKGLFHHLIAQVEIAVYLLFLCWTFFRLLIALRVAASASIFKVFFTFTGMNFILFLIIGGIIQYQSSFIHYLGFLVNL